MTDHSPTTPGPRRPARPRPLAEREERCAPDADAVSPRPGHGVAHVGARVRAREDGGPADAAVVPSPPTAGHYRGGCADDRLRRALARLRRNPDAAVRAAGDVIAAEAAAALLALAERASQADPVTRRRLAQAAARTARLTARLDDALAAREGRRADG